MKKTIMFFALLLAVVAVQAQRVAKDVSNARQAVATILTFSNGELKGNGTGVFLGENGELLASRSLFLGVDSAVTIDPAGKVRPVERILGVNEMFDCVKVRVAWDRKIKSLPIAGQGVAAGEELYMLSYGTKKNGVITPLTVDAVDSIYSCGYYTFSFPMQQQYLSLPVVNVEGELVGIMQPVSRRDTIHSYAVSASFASGLAPGSLNYGRGYYPGMRIRTAMPATKEAAMSCMYMQTIAGDSASYRGAIEDFISLYPESYEGYLSRAEFQAVFMRDLDLATASWERALSFTDNKGEIYFNKAKVINSIVQSGDTLSSPLLSYSNAMAALDKAIEADNQPLYVNYKADMLYSQGNYTAASDCYEALTATPLRSPDIFARAAQCQNMLENYDRSIALLDSAVCYFGADTLAASAPYLLTRAIVNMTAGNYRAAVFDYNKYGQIMQGSLNASFYYMREQAELKARMFQQALDDIDTAIYLDPQNLMYYIEKALICYRVKMPDEGISSLETAKEIVGEEPSIYYMLGRLYLQAENVEKAKENLQKALSLGYSEAEELLRTIDAE